MLPPVLAGRLAACRLQILSDCPRCCANEAKAHQGLDCLFASLALQRNDQTKTAPFLQQMASCPCPGLGRGLHVWFGLLSGLSNLLKRSRTHHSCIASMRPSISNNVWRVAMIFRRSRSSFSRASRLKRCSSLIAGVCGGPGLP